MKKNILHLEPGVHGRGRDWQLCHVFCVSFLLGYVTVLNTGIYPRIAHAAITGCRLMEQPKAWRYH